MSEYLCNKIVEEYLENAYIKSNFNIHNKTNDEIDKWWNYVFLPNVVRNDTQYDYEYNINDFYDPDEFWKLAPKELLVNYYCNAYFSIAEFEKLDNSHLQNCYAEIYAYNNSDYLKDKIVFRINNWRLFTH
jgi:hypothetical protein